MSDPWYKRNARDFYEGTRRLTLEQRGAYADLIDLIYIHDGEVPDDEDWIAHALYISRRKWRPIRAALIDAGKITSEDGRITNSRAQIELKNQRARREINRENASGQRPVKRDSAPNQHPLRSKPDANGAEKLNKNSNSGEQFPTLCKKEEEERRKRPPNPLEGGTVGDEVLVTNSGVILAGSVRDRWLTAFDGDAEQLRLALIEVRGRIQPNSRSHSVQVQVEKQLASMVRDKRDRDRRYAEACQRNRPKAVSSHHRDNPNWVRI